MSQTHAIRILATGDHAVLRSSLCLLLDREDYIETVSEATTAEEAIGLARAIGSHSAHVMTTLRDSSGVSMVGHALEAGLLDDERNRSQ